MNIKKIKYIEEEPLKIQVNKLKRLLIEANVILGKKFTLEIASLTSQIEKLINFYDSKKIPSRFNSSAQALELNLKQ